MAKQLAAPVPVFLSHCSAAQSPPLQAPFLISESDGSQTLVDSFPTLEDRDGGKDTKKKRSPSHGGLQISLLQKCPHMTIMGVNQIEDGAEDEY